MSTATDLIWLVGRAGDVGQLEERLGPIDATIQETWPADVNAGIVALVRSADGDAPAAQEALGADARRYDSEEEARTAAVQLVGSR